MPRIEPTEELLERLTRAQAKHTAEILTNPYNRMGDDWGDYTNSALDCMRVLFDMRWDQADLVSLDKWLNTPIDKDNSTNGMIKLDIGEVPQLGMCACDGICNELYELDCPALPKDDEPDDQAHHNH